MVAVNKLLSTTAQPRLIDFAVARIKSKGERARDAVGFLNGTIGIKPTCRTASMLFGISVTSIQNAKKAAAREQPVADPGLLASWARANEDERTAFLRVVADSIWFDIARATAPVPKPKSPLNGHAPQRRRPTLPTIHIQAAE